MLNSFFCSQKKLFRGYGLWRIIFSLFYSFVSGRRDDSPLKGVSSLEFFSAKTNLPVLFIQPRTQHQRKVNKSWQNSPLKLPLPVHTPAPAPAPALVPRGSPASPAPAPASASAAPRGTPASLHHMASLHLHHMAGFFFVLLLCIRASHQGFDLGLTRVGRLVGNLE